MARLPEQYADIWSVRSCFEEDEETDVCGQWCFDRNSRGSSCPCVKPFSVALKRREQALRARRCSLQLRVNTEYEWTYVDCPPINQKSCKLPISHRLIVYIWTLVRIHFFEKTYDGKPNICQFRGIHKFRFGLINGLIPLVICKEKKNGQTSFRTSVFRRNGVRTNVPEPV